jgi:NTE family protein
MRLTALITALLLCAGCAHFPVNEPLEVPSPEHGYRFRNLSHEGNSDEIFVCLTFSGGGVRASSLAYGVLQLLRDTEIEVEGERRRLLDEVDVISSVSGGSFTAAYYAIYGDEIFETFERRFLHRNFQRQIVLSALNPLQWPRYLSRQFSLTDRTAEIYERGLFGGVTYGDLARGARPFIILNATDITQGQPFQFTQDQFDFLQSDLSSVPVARAVTASSAVPVAFAPLALRAYHHQEDFVLPNWVTEQLNFPDFPSRAWQQASQLHYYTDEERSQWVHLIDGGVTDNLGVTPLIHPARDEINDLSIGQMVDPERVRHGLFIMVNAATHPDTDWTMRSHPPGGIAILNKAIAGLMSNTTVSASRALRHRAITARADNPDVSITLVEIGFANLPVEEKSFYRNVATSLFLATETYERLIEVGARLLAESEEYQRFVASLNGEVHWAPSTEP